MADFLAVLLDSSLFWYFMYFLCESMIEFRSFRIASLLSRRRSPPLPPAFQQSVLAERKLTGGRFVKLDICLFYFLYKVRKLYFSALELTVYSLDLVDFLCVFFIIYFSNIKTELKKIKYIFEYDLTCNITKNIKLHN